MFTDKKNLCYLLLISRSSLNSKLDQHTVLSFQGTYKCRVILFLVNFASIFIGPLTDSCSTMSLIYFKAFLVVLVVIVEGKYRLETTYRIDSI